MTSTGEQAPSTLFRIGWWMLIVLSVLAFVNHASLMFFMPGQEVLFLGWAFFNLYSSVVLLIPYRKRERWAWYLTWALIVPFLVIFVWDASIGAYYVGAGVLMIVGQLLTRSAFFSE